MPSNKKGHEKELKELRFENAVLHLMLRRYNLADSILGFKLATKKTKTHGKEYEKWYGYIFIGGKTVWIYVGEKKNAEEKIKNWLKKNFHRLKSLVNQDSNNEKK